jgi:hypothetical protein|tara:strand:- start:509 stop:1135 length:627 start_codon:yes stop_codon:yes gene_type:complete
MAAPSYPLTLPTAPAFSKARWTLKRATAMSESPFTGQQQVFDYGYALWTATLTLPPMMREQAANWEAFMMKLHGRKGTFLLGDPDAKTIQGGATTSATLDGAISVGDFTISINTNNANLTNIFKAGDYIQIGTAGASKLYMIVDNATSNSSGIASVNIEPAIKTAASDGAAVDYTEAQGVFRMDSADLGWDTNEVSRYGITFSCTEAL